MPANKPDPASLEAARKIATAWESNRAYIERVGVDVTTLKLAAIIDSTTHVGELREALEQFLECSPCRSGCAKNDMTCAYTQAESLLAKLPKEGK